MKKVTQKINPRIVLSYTSKYRPVKRPKKSWLDRNLDTILLISAVSTFWIAIIAIFICK